MFKNNYIFHLFSLIILTKISLGSAVFDEEDDLVTEIFVDLIVGIGMAICESYATCNMLLTTVSCITVIIVLISVCMGSIYMGDICNRRMARRSFTSYSGYSFGRAFLRS